MAPLKTYEGLIKHGYPTSRLNFLVEFKSVLNKAKFVDVKVCEKISNFLKENFIEDLKYFEKKIK